MSARFGFDFSSVRIHHDGQAAASAHAVGALAYTVGRDIVFAPGYYRPASAGGARLLAHELTHVVQQSGARYSGHGPPVADLRLSSPGDEAEREAAEFASALAQPKPPTPVTPRAAHGVMVQRVVTESSIKAKNGDFYSTNCGWVDTGHVNPGLARGLIARVREASQRIERREQALTRTLAAEPPGLVSESVCPASYEKGEETESRADAPVMSEKQHPSGAVDIFLGGFEVNRSDPAKFTGIVRHLALIHAAWETLRGQKFGVEVWGFSDCIGQADRNNYLRLARAASISSAFSGASRGMIVNLRTSHAVTDFAVSNSTRAGRRQNRGVLIRFVPQVTPETFGTPTMESRKWGIRGTAVTPQAELTRSLSEEEVLSVALTIFAAQSTAFEFGQAWLPSGSSFSEEDLPSNLIGFYRAARGFDFNEVRSICGAWDQQRSLDRLKGYAFVQNRTFQPQRLPPGGVWPAEFQTIVPAPFGSEAFRILQLRMQVPLMGIDLDCTIDAKTYLVKCR